MATHPLSHPEAPRAQAPTAGPPFHRILAATDLSPDRDTALQAAATYARLFNADLRLVYVLPETAHQAMASSSYSDFHTTILPADDREFQDERRGEAQAALERLRADPALAGVRISTDVVEMPVLEGIAAASERFDADLVVMATHARHGLDRLWSGSVAEEVLHHSRSPVLAIGPAATAPARLDSILLASNLGSGAPRVARYAAAIARDRQASLALMHVVPGEVPLVHTADAAAIEARLAALLPDDDLPARRAQIRIDFGDPAQEILRAAQELKPDLLVVGTEYHPAYSMWPHFATHMPWSVLPHILPAVTCPVLAVPALLAPSRPH